MGGSPRDLRELLTSRAIRRLATAAAFDRGVAYYRDDRVEIDTTTDRRLLAVVRGTAPYRVELRSAARGLSWSCSCPVGESGEFCKHCVAVAQSLNPSGEDTSGSDATNIRAGSTRAGRRAVEPAEVKARISSAFGSKRRFVDYAEAPSWAAGVHAAIDELEDLVQSQSGTQTVTLVEYAHAKADSAMDHIDDSDGWLTQISVRLGALHLRACEHARLAPVALARRLVKLELSEELGAFHRAALTYAELLGQRGLDEYRRLIDPKWQDLRADADPWSAEAFRVRQSRIGVALAANDPDELIMVRRRDLRSPDEFLEIVQALCKVDREEEAITWGRKGLEVFAERAWQTSDLRSLVATLLRGRRDGDAALELYWGAYTTEPSLELYRQLLAEADRSGRRTEWQQRALDALRALVEDGASRRAWGTRPADVLVQILLFEAMADEAWAVFTEHGCARPLELALARTREQDHPLDAVSVYEREVESQISTKTNIGYRSAVKYLTCIEELAGRADAPDRYVALVARVRYEHKAKRNLMALLDRLR